jgi:hypothetical protein
MVEGRTRDYSGSAVEPRRWTDERLDDLAEAMMSGCERVDQDMRELRQTMLRAWITMLATQVIGFLGVLAAILARGA